MKKIISAIAAATLITSSLMMASCAKSGSGNLSDQTENTQFPVETTFVDYDCTTPIPENLATTVEIKIVPDVFSEGYIFISDGETERKIESEVVFSDSVSKSDTGLTIYGDGYGILMSAKSIFTSNLNKDDIPTYTLKRGAESLGFAYCGNTTMKLMRIYDDNFDNWFEDHAVYGQNEENGYAKYTLSDLDTGTYIVEIMETKEYNYYDDSQYYNCNFHVTHHDLHFVRLEIVDE